METSKVRGVESVLRLLEAKVEAFGPRLALASREGGGWREWTYLDLAARVRALTSHWLASGVRPGDRVAILSESRPEWCAAFLATARAGAVSVPLDVKLTESELAAQLSDARPALLCASPGRLDAARRLAARLAPPPSLVSLEEGPGEPDAPGLGAIEEAPHEPVERRLADAALIAYTSGASGKPKGVVISFGNLAFQVVCMEALMELEPADRFLSILPLNHLIELTGGLLAPLHSGAAVQYAGSLLPQELSAAMRERGISAMLGVPLFYRTLRKALAASSPADARRRLGGRLRILISGGAPLDRETLEYYDRLGVPLLQGYGLTEASPVVTLNGVRSKRLGSVGRALPGTEVKVAAGPGGEGEVLVRGPHVMKGYFRDPDLTAESVDAQGWLRTGDVGRLDADGFLYITGRLKSLIVLDGGKKVQPEEVESVLGGAPGIEELCVVGSRSGRLGRERVEEVCAVVVPAEELRRGHEDPRGLAAAVERALSGPAAELAAFKRPTRVVLHGGRLPRTATQKIRRAEVARWLERQGEGS